MVAGIHNRRAQSVLLLEHWLQRTQHVVGNVDERQPDSCRLRGDWRLGGHNVAAGTNQDDSGEGTEAVSIPCIEGAHQPAHQLFFTRRI
jgi:hypothetical protein